MARRSLPKRGGGGLSRVAKAKAKAKTKAKAVAAWFNAGAGAKAEATLEPRPESSRRANETASRISEKSRARAHTTKRLRENLQTTVNTYIRNGQVSPDRKRDGASGGDENCERTHATGSLEEEEPR